MKKYLLIIESKDGLTFKEYNSRKKVLHAIRMINETFTGLKFNLIH